MPRFLSHSLSGQWQLRQPDADSAPLPAAVPGDVHSALLAAGRITEPTVGDRIPELLWVGRADWEYRHTFDLPADLLALPQLWLEFEAIDTHATIVLNDQELGRTDNVFRQWRFDVAGLLREKENRLMVTLASAHRVGEEKKAALPFPLEQGLYIDSPGMNLQRKVQCHGGWDWGPELLQHGIPREVRIVGFDQFRLENVVTTQRHSDGLCEVDVSVLIEGVTACETLLEVTLGEERVELPVVIEPGENRFDCTLAIRNPELWWPNGYGAQPLYDLRVKAGDQTRTKRLGLRSLELVREPDEIGESFLFRVNSTDVVCKGANWIPCDNLWSRQTDEVYTRLIRDSAAANMNMLRIWGGGQFEPEIFYDRCDEAGILIWHDLMFACAPYPADPDFLQNVRIETVEQITRLRDHACIALWCGGNELLGSGTFKRQLAANPPLYMVNYERLSHTLSEAVAAADPTRVFWPTSPCMGPMDFSGYWYDDSRGDTHFWDVGTGFDGRAPEDADAYLRIQPRFCSEFGMQAMPSMETIRAMIESESDLNLNSPVMRSHEQWSAGNRGLVEMMFAYTRLPSQFEDFVYASQVIQALGIKTAAEFWRSTKPRNMGVLFWQLNDIWPCPSWASLDYYGSWKQLHYHARRFFDPLLIGGVMHSASDELRLFAVSDLPHEVQAEARWRVIDLEGQTGREEKKSITLNGNRSITLAEGATSQFTADPNRTFLQLDLTGEGFSRTNTVFFRRFRDMPLPAAKIRVEPEIRDGALSIGLETDRPAFCVEVEGIGSAGYLSDNSITLLPGERRELKLIARQGVNEERLKKIAENLRVQHIGGM